MKQTALRMLSLLQTHTFSWRRFLFLEVGEIVFWAWYSLREATTWFEILWAPLSRCAPFLRTCKSIACDLWPIWAKRCHPPARSAAESRLSSHPEKYRRHLLQLSIHAIKTRSSQENENMVSQPSVGTSKIGSCSSSFKVSSVVRLSTLASDASSVGVYFRVLKGLARSVRDLCRRKHSYDKKRINNGL